ncbi:hypothetical protein FGB62_291g07 [Gracilaria domingensis]|nr:hypothetical protein FGB62_291g07 [Gracilaria domingensis]
MLSSATVAKPTLWRGPLGCLFLRMSFLVFCSGYQHYFVIVEVAYEPVMTEPEDLNFDDSFNFVLVGKALAKWVSNFVLMIFGLGQIVSTGNVFRSFQGIYAGALACTKPWQREGMVAFPELRELEFCWKDWIHLFEGCMKVLSMDFDDNDFCEESSSEEHDGKGDDAAEGEDVKNSGGGIRVNRVNNVADLDCNRNQNKECEKGGREFSGRVGDEKNAENDTNLAGESEVEKTENAERRPQRRWWTCDRWGESQGL